MRICETQSEMLDTLFTPGGTADGYVIKRTKRTVSFWCRGQAYRMNRYGVVYLGRDGGGGLMFDELTSSECQEIADQLAKDAQVEKHQGEPCLCYPDGKYTERSRAFL